MPFLAAAVVVAASYGSGTLLTGGGRIRIEDGLRRRLTVFTVGYVFLLLVVFVLGYTSLFNRPALIALTVAAAALAVPGLRSELRAARDAWRRATWMRKPLVAIALLLALDVFLASAPPTSGDAIAYHLSAPKEWLQAGHIFPIWWDWNTFQPFTTELHQALAQALWDGRAAMVVTALLAAFSTCCVFGLARELAGDRPAAVAALFWTAQGMFVWEATGGFVELALAGLIALSAWHLVALRKSQRASDALWAGIAIGAAAATKYHGLIFLLAFALLVPVLARRRGAALGLFAAGAAVALPWYVRNWIVTGNPFYPFAAGVFGGKYLSSNSLYDLNQSLAGYGVHGLWRLPFFPLEFLLHTARFERGYSFGPALFLLPPIAVILGGRWARLLGLGLLAYLLLWWESLHQVTRYLLPVLPFAVVLAGYGAVVLWDRRGGGRAAVLAVAVLTVVPFVAIAGALRVADRARSARNREHRGVRAEANRYVRRVRMARPQPAAARARPPRDSRRVLAESTLCGLRRTVVQLQAADRRHDRPDAQVRRALRRRLQRTTPDTARAGQAAVPAPQATRRPVRHVARARHGPARGARRVGLVRRPPEPLPPMTSPERIVPDREQPGILALHLKRYVFAAEYCQGKDVLDAACGVGYGTAELARVATEVVGVDVDPAAIEYARQRYAGSNIRFEVMDVEALQFGAGSFDVVVSFETIEHVADRDAFLTEVARVLRPSGRFIVSTPSGTRTTTSPDNPFHRIEYSRADFEHVLSAHFASVELFGQRRTQTRRHRALQRIDVLGLRRRLTFMRHAAPLVGTAATVDATLAGIVITRDGLERATELVAVCSGARP